VILTFVHGCKSNLNGPTVTAVVWSEMTITPTVVDNAFSRPPRLTVATETQGSQLTSTSMKTDRIDSLIDPIIRDEM